MKTLIEKIDDILYEYADFKDEFDRHRCNNKIIQAIKENSKPSPDR